MAESSAHVRSDGRIAQVGPSRAFLTSLHPSGNATVIRPIDDLADEQSTADVVVLAMSPDQCSDKAQRDPLIKRAVSALAPDGMIWVVVPGRWRTDLMSALRNCGMATGVLTVHRSRGAGEAQIALTARALRFALDRGHLSRRWRSVVEVLQSTPFGRTLLTRLLPSVGFAAFRPGTRPFGWLLDRVTANDVDIMLITNWRGERAPYLVFALGTEETLVAKRGGGECEAQISHEAAMLKLLGPGLAHCGLEVPRLIESHSTPALSTLVESDVPGRPMAGLIREGHHRDFGAIAERLAEWLTCWNGETLRRLELTRDLADRLILSAARPLVSAIDRGSAYLEWLSSQTAQVIGSEVALVAAHNDLTMANVLGDSSRLCSVVDWEAASPDGLPLTDFRYAACDAAATIAGGDRLTAFRACFLADGEYRRRFNQSEAPLRAIADGRSEWLELCIHAGWLRHAANEQARSPSSRVDRSFIAIANLLAESAIAS